MVAVTYGPVGLPVPAAFVGAELFRLVQVQRYGDVLVCMNTFHMARETTGGTAAGLVSDWVTNIVPTWRANVGGAMMFREVYAQKIMPNQDAITSNPLALGGTLAPMVVPSVCAGVITWRSSFIGRRARGRTYVPGLCYSLAAEWGTGFTWGTTNITRLTNIGNVILNRYTLGGNPNAFQLVVYSRKTQSENPPSTWMNAVLPVSRFTVQNYIATMGTRRSGRGI
jgi:hypothetical protein